MQATTSSGPDATSLTRDLYAVLLHLMKTGQADVLRAIADLELSLTQVKTLSALDTAGEALPLSSLAEELGVSLPAMSRCVEGLHLRGLVERREDAEDRRMRRVELTATGRDVPRDLNAARLSHLEEFVASLDPEDAERLAAALAPIAARADISSCRPAEETSR